MAAFSWFAGQRPLSSLARQASVNVALQSMSAFVRVVIKAVVPVLVALGIHWLPSQLTLYTMNTCRTLMGRSSLDSWVVDGLDQNQLPHLHSRHDKNRTDSGGRLMQEII